MMMCEIYGLSLMDGLWVFYEMYGIDDELIV